MKLDRELQLTILKKLAETYPDRHSSLMRELGEVNQNDVIANLLYLEEHGLIYSGLKQPVGGKHIYVGATITARGLDFLADDGGLSAILGVVTVKFQEETLRALMQLRIEESDLPAPDKKHMLAKLRDLPAEAIKHITLRLVDKGMEQGPNLWSLLQTSGNG